jgi:DNA-binding CsgD family transcriptional regulator
MPVATMVTNFDRFDHVLGQIYQAAIDSTQWARCLEEIRIEFEANFSSLIVRRGAGVDIGLIVSASGGVPLSDDHTFVATSPFQNLPLDKVVTLGEILSDADWRKSDYYKDWCAPHGVFYVLACDIRTSSGGVYGFRVTRPEGSQPFSTADRMLAERLVPHLRRALELHEVVYRDRKISSLYSTAMAQMLVGVILIDENGCVQEINSMAKGILQMNDGLKLVGDRLEAAYGEDNRKMHRLIRQMLTQEAPLKVGLIEALSVSRPSGKVNFGVVIKAITPDEWTEGKHRPSVAVFVRDCEAKADPVAGLAQKMFQLTPAETALVIHLANGLSLDEASEVLDIRRNTARAHLRSIYSKTGVRRQPELVRIFLNSVVMLGSGDST